MMKLDDETTIPHVTRHDTFKTGVYIFFGIAVAILLIGGTILLFVTG